MGHVAREQALEGAVAVRDDVGRVAVDDDRVHRDLRVRLHRERVLEIVVVALRGVAAVVPGPVEERISSRAHSVILSAHALSHCQWQL